MTRVLTVRGAGESIGPNQMLGGVVRGLESTALDYPAEVRPIGVRTLQESVNLGRAALRSFDALGGPWVFAGFSLGAYTLVEYLMLDHPKNCKGGVLLGNPLRPRGKCANAGVPGDRFGLAGEVPVAGVTVHDFSVPDDPISACPKDNGLRVIAPYVTGRRQPTPAGWWNAGATIEWLLKYVGPTSRHVAYNERMPGSQLTYTQAARAALEGML